MTDETDDASNNRTGGHQHHLSFGNGFLEAILFGKHVVILHHNVHRRAGDHSVLNGEITLVYRATQATGTRRFSIANAVPTPKTK